MKASRLTVLLMIFALVGAACGGDSGTTTTVGSPSGSASSNLKTNDAVDSLEDVRGAIVRIVAEGSFADPEYGQQYNAAGSGSGFFIDSTGIAVTNNHVVTGAAFLQVYVDGEEEPRNARVLGVSECSDLAVIDVDGDGYSYLEWYDGDVSVGTEIYAAGFPLGDEEYTLLDGIISKENAFGESNWASVEHVIEHSADTLPGNSGGPIVSADGKIVAVNYAGDINGQSFGIGRDVALETVPMLVDGEDVTSIGINGEAFSDGTFSGIWVASVASGSAADLGGIRSGDVLTLVEGLIPSTDGTMADYCDVLRSHAPGDPLSVEVYRPAEDAFLEGTLNTDKALALAFSFESALQDDVAAPADDAASPAPGYPAYETVVDASNTMTVDVPAAWADRNVDPWTFDDELVGAAISASVDRQAWADGYVTPGVFFGASATLPFDTVDALLDYRDFSGACALDGRYEYDDGRYAGAYDLWVGCDGTDSRFINLVAKPIDWEILISVQVTVVSDADLEALDTVLATFVVDEVALANLASGDTSSPPPAGGSVVGLRDLLPGDCFNDADVVFDEATANGTVTLVSCDVPHDNEAVYSYTFPDTQFMSQELIFEHLDEWCPTYWPDYVGIPYENSALYMFYYYPTSETWNAGDRRSVCVAYDGSLEPITGSVYMSGY